jgi:hypothetical protein
MTWRVETVQIYFFIDSQDVSVYITSTRGRSDRSNISMAWEKKNYERGLNKSVSRSVSLRALDLDLLAILMHLRTWCPMACHPLRLYV